ncbi:MAG: RidA family protein [Alphaproteobacteria bacterium]|jgi:enamine deaminase RidA (YjgF/YER057c/UK114 family)
MTNIIAQRLAELGIELPTPRPPAANYTPYVISGNLVFISGQVPVGPQGLEFRGKCGAAFNVAQAQQAARLCALNMLAHLREACAGNLDQVRQCVRIEGFVNATPEFGEHPAVINGASDLIADVFGAKGVHARFAVGCNSLPFDVAVEIAGIFAIESAR